MKIRITGSILLMAILLAASCATSGFDRREFPVVQGPSPPVGAVSVQKRYWHWFFVSHPDRVRHEMLQLAETRAGETYGKGNFLANVQVQSSYSYWSMVLYFDIFGFVENVTLMADVYPDSVKNGMHPSPGAATHP